MEDDDIPAIVIDSGSGSCRAGFAGDDGPREMFSSVIGSPRFHNEDIAIDTCFVGDEAQIIREFLSFNYPIQRGVVTNWDNAEKIWDFAFKQLRVEPTSHPVLMSEPVLNPVGNRERLFECMFEKFQVPSFFSINSALLNLYASGRGVGLVLDIGEGLTQLMPIYFTFGRKHATICQELGGADMTHYLQKLLHDRGYSFTTTAEWEYVREIKESVCYSSLDFDKDMSSSQTVENEYTLPDGNKFTLGKEKFQCVECLFQPSLLGYKDSTVKGLSELLKISIESCDLDIRKDFYCNLLICGGGTLMPHITERIDKIWRSIVPKACVSRVVATPERKYNVWIGGSIQASLSTFQQAWISKAKYEEYGPSVVHRYCV